MVDARDDGEQPAVSPSGDAATVAADSGDASTLGAPDVTPSSSRAGGVPQRLGRFEIRRELGRGGMGAVFEAFDPELGRAVAVKVVHGEPGSEHSRARLKKEARALAQIAHPNVVGISRLPRRRCAHRPRPPHRLGHALARAPVAGAEPPRSRHVADRAALGVAEDVLQVHAAEREGGHHVGTLDRVQIVESVEAPEHHQDALGSA